MKFNAQVLRNAGVAAAGALASAAAMAQGAGDPFTTAVTEVTGKVADYGAALVGVSAVFVVFAIAMKYVKKLPRAA